jgi:hypothetical protein
MSHSPGQFATEKLLQVPEDSQSHPLALLQAFLLSLYCEQSVALAIVVFVASLCEVLDFTLVLLVFDVCISVAPRAPKPNTTATAIKGSTNPCDLLKRYLLCI